MPRTYSHIHDPHHVFEADTIRGFTEDEVDKAVEKAKDITASAAEIDTAVGYANKLSTITEEWDGRSVIIANGGNIEPQQLFAFDIDITQLPAVTTQITPNELTEAIREGKMVYFSLYGYKIVESGFTYIDDADIFCPNPLIISNSSIYSGGVMVLSFSFYPSNLDSAFNLILNTIDFNTTDGTLYEHNILIRNSLNGVGGCLTILNNSSVSMVSTSDLGNWLYNRGYDSNLRLYPIASDWISDTVSSIISCGIYANSSYEVYIHNAGINKALNSNNEITAISSNTLANSITDTVIMIY